MRQTSRISRLITCLFPVFFLSVPLSGQVDSLLSVVANPTNDTADINAYRQLIKEVFREEPDAALEYARTMIRLAEERNLPRWSALGCSSLGALHWIEGRSDSSRHYYELGLERLGDPTNHPLAGVGLLINLGAYYQRNNQLDEAIRLFGDAYELGEASGYTKEQPKVLNNLGALYRQIGRPESARRAYEESMRLKVIANDSLGMAVTLANLGKIRLELDDIAGAEADLERSKLLYALIGYQDQVASVDAMRGVAYYKRGESRKARETILTALDDPDLRLDLQSVGNLYFVVAETYREEGRLEQALQFLKQGEPYAKQSGIMSLKAYYERAFGRVYQALGRETESSAFFAEFSERIDTVIQLQLLDTQREAAESFQARLREAEIERQQLLITQQRQRQRLLWLGLVGLTLLALFITLLLRSRIKIQRSEARRLEAERTAEVYRLQQETELSNLRSMMEGQEAERRRVAKDLHDGLGGLLATVKARMSATETIVPDTNRLIDRACTEVRRIAHNMMPQTLSLSGLSGAVRDIVAQLNLRGLDTELELVGQPDLRLDEDGQTMLLRIIQELTHNVVKHAEASKLFIQLLDQPTQLLLTVEDNGRGFNPENLTKANAGLGLSSIENRAAYLRGELQFDSSPGHGTTVTLTIPL